MGIFLPSHTAEQAFYGAPRFLFGFKYFGDMSPYYFQTFFCGRNFFFSGYFKLFLDSERIH